MTLPAVGKARHHLRDTIRALLESGEVSYSALVASGAITNGTLGRVVSDEGQDVRLEQLDWLAAALDMDPWQLLHPDTEVAQFSKQALKIARKMDSLPPEVRDQAYALFVQAVDFANVAPPPAAPASAPSTAKPKRLRRVHR